MKKLDMEKAIKRYNDIMNYVGCEHVTINTRYSEDTENWNLRDMVAEADYWLSCYYESGNVRNDFRFDSADDYKVWLSETGKLKRFIKAYEPFIEEMVCTEGHHSRFDN